jgi:uncharacterized protein (TIGR03382 family)
MKRHFRAPVIATVLGLVACAAQPDDAGSSANSAVVQDNGAIVIGDVGSSKELKVTVSGVLHADEKAFPIGLGDRCQSARGTDTAKASNFAYVQLKNSDTTAKSVALALSGRNLSTAHLLAYGDDADSPPKTAADADKCLTLAHGMQAGADGKNVILAGGPRLASDVGSGIVIGPKSSVHVLLATEATLGTYNLTVRTDGTGAVDQGSISILQPGQIASGTVLVSGAARFAGALLPNGVDDKCGGSRGKAAGAATNYGYVELKNGTDTAQPVAVRMGGSNLGDAQLLAYAAAAAPKDAKEADKCLALARGSATVAPTLSSTDGLVVPAKGSIYVLVATKDSTGLYNLEVRSGKGDNGDEATKDAGSTDTKQDAGSTDSDKHDAGAPAQNDAGTTTGTGDNTHANDQADEWSPQDTPQAADSPSRGDGEDSTPTKKSSGTASSGCSTTPAGVPGGASIFLAAVAAVSLLRRRKER